MSNELAGRVLRTNLGSYALYADVASGGFGTVSFGRDLQSNRAIAIKRLHGHLAYEPAVVERFRQEAQRLRGLQHPNIVQVLDEGTDSGGLPFIILQWVEGWTVAALLEQTGRFAIPEAVEIACQVLAALEAAGRRGVVHRDIKPSNLMVTPPPDRQVKVMDFGIAKDLQADVRSQYTQIGTIAYMAPEQFSQAPVDARTDLYALGVTLYELLTGQRPSGALTPESPTSLRELRPEVDPALAAIVYRALEKRPMDRFQTPADMRAALAPFVGRAVDLTVLAAGSAVQHTVPPQAHLAELYAAASEAFEGHDWAKTVGLLEAVTALDPSYRDADALLADARRRALAAEQPVSRTSEPPPTPIPVKRHLIGPRAADRARRLPRASDDASPKLEFEAPISDVGRRAASERDENSAGGGGRRRIGAPIWAGGAVALLAIGVVVQQVASGQTGQGVVSTPAPVEHSTEVARSQATPPLPTDVPPTAIPRAVIPPTAVPTPAAAPTSAAALPSTPAPGAGTGTLTLPLIARTPSSATELLAKIGAPTATPTVDDLWRAVLVQLDPIWSRDWPEAIKLLSAFVAAHPGYPSGQDKLYAARLFYADELLAAGNLDGAVEQLDAANTLLPQRPDAQQTLVALTPTPTATTAPPAVIKPAQPKPAVPQQQPAEPAPAPPPSLPPTPKPLEP